ncbi:hypothetical protein [Microbacterium sp.]|uniref:hypothetical protein n=1 Tax=Microbacterium sp. TaxID=51671 RepID=UPI0026263F1E|nr:hypothetical protein [Microbacterium sp.]MCV0333934.1 hypothetical protein [Microbacterium sp.]MCV0374538.1 hypothetical protein [Microbacterium sp.]MCV0389610.1 hypothetical protein [Microbacterium sp.]MCV0419145.1 hypothetical protein [Microbacterium sp.]MCV0421450.1 hypothetical protein [Microbacterium sp.]
MMEPARRDAALFEVRFAPARRIDDDGSMLWPFGSTWRPVRQRRRDTVDLRWLSARTWTRRWYPQGVDVGEWRGRRTLAVSWFRQELSGEHLASRVTLVDLERSRHIDILLAVTDDEGELQPARIHAGGLAWFGDRLFAAATGRGVWEFDMSDIRQVRGALAQRLAGARRRGGRTTALIAVRTRVHPIALRCSYLGRVFDDGGASLPRVLIGEHRTDDSGRIGEFIVPASADDDFAEVDRFTPGIPRMQGAVRWGDRHFVSQSDRMHPGTLWSGRREALAPAPVPLPVGCEDLALDLEAGLLWSLGEHPWRRVVRGIPFPRLGIPRSTDDGTDDSTRDGGRPQRT